MYKGWKWKLLSLVKTINSACFVNCNKLNVLKWESWRLCNITWIFTSCFTEKTLLKKQKEQSKCGMEENKNKRLNVIWIWLEWLFSPIPNPVIWDNPRITTSWPETSKHPHQQLTTNSAKRDLFLAPEWFLTWRGRGEINDRKMNTATLPQMQILL